MTRDLRMLHVYTADTLNPGTVDGYAAAADGTLAEGETLFDFARDDRPFALLPSPDGQRLFTIGGDGSITTLAVAADGSLSFGSRVAAGVYPNARPVISPDGRSLYALGPTVSSLTQWTIAENGVVTPKAAPALRLPAAVPGIGMSPDGQSFYVASTAGLQRYAVAADGTLSPVGAPVGPTGSSYRSLAVSSDGRSIYAASISPPLIGQWDVAADGSVSAKAPPSLASAGSAPDVLGLTPFSRGVYALPIAQVEQFGVGPGGALTRLTPALIPTNQQRAVASSPDGRSLYVARIGAIDQYDVADNGLLSRKPAGPVGAGAAVDVVTQPSQGPRAALAAPATAAAGDQVAFDASASDAPGGFVDRYDWDFGDGTAEPDAGATPFHAFAAPGTYTVSVTVTDGAGCADGVYNGRYTLCRARGATATGTVVVTAAAANLAVAKTASTSAVQAGDQFSYLLRATNAGPSEVTDATIADTLPDGLTIDAIQPSQGACALDGRKLTCRLGTLRSQDSALVLVFARAGAALAGSSIANAASVSSGLPDPDTSDNAASATVAVTAEDQGSQPEPGDRPQPDADLTLRKSVATESVQVGRPAAYTLRVVNRGPRTARDARLVDSYSGRPLAVRTSRGRCRRAAALVCRLGDLAPGRAAVVAVVTRPLEPGTTVNEAVVVSDSADPRAANNVAVAHKRIGARLARLQLTLGARRERLPGGQDDRFTVLVRSTGRDAALRTAACVRTPAALTPVRLGGATQRGDRLCWRIARLATGTQRTFSFTARASRPPQSLHVAVRGTAASLDARAVSARASLLILAAPPPAPPPRVTG